MGKLACAVYISAPPPPQSYCQQAYQPYWEHTYQLGARKNLEHYKPKEEPIGLKARISFQTDALKRFASDWKNIQRLNEIEKIALIQDNRMPLEKFLQWNDEKLPLLKELQRLYASASIGDHEITASLYELDQKDFESKLNSKAGISGVLKEGFYDEQGAEAIVNFAGARVGGKPFGTGLTMEENLVLKRFEYALMAGMQMYEDYKDNTERTLAMYPTEAIIFSPAPQVFTYDMYGKVKAKRSNWNLQTHFDAQGGPLVISIDAFRFKKGGLLYTQEQLYGILKKAYVGFWGAKAENRDLKTVKTGKWGCGVFANNVDVIFVLQHLAASMAGIELEFHVDYAEEVANGQAFLQEHKDKTVRECIELLESMKWASPALNKDLVKKEE